MNVDLSPSWQNFRQSPRENTFEPFYQAALPLVYTICVRLSRSVEDAEDACQSSFKRMVQEVQSGSEETKLEAKTYVCRVAAREADALKKRQLRCSERENAMKGMSSEESLEQASYTDQELRLTVEKILESLPEELRVPVQLHYLHGFTQQEIADTLEIPRTTIASRMKKALGELETKLRSEGITNAGAVLTTIAGMAVLLQPGKAVSAAAVWTSVGVGGAGAGMIAGSGFSGYLSVKVFGAVVGVALVAVVTISLPAIMKQTEKADDKHESLEEVRVSSLDVKTPSPDLTPGSDSESAVQPSVNLVSALPKPPADRQQVKAPYRITGRVTDLKERPIPSITIQHDLFGSSELTPENSTSTRADGSFDLWLNEDNTNYLMAFGEGWAPKWYQDIAPGSPNDPLEVSFTLEPGRTMKGIVKDLQGRPVEKAMILCNKQLDELKGMPGSFGGISTNASGQFVYPNLPSGEVCTHVFAEGLGSFNAPVNVSEFQEIVLGEAAFIFGHVVDANTGEPIKEFNLKRSMSSEFNAINDSRGEFLLTMLDQQRHYQLVFSAEGYLDLIMDDVSPWTSQEDRQLTVQLTSGDLIRWEVVDADSGEPVSNAVGFTGNHRKNWFIDWKEFQKDWKPAMKRGTAMRNIQWGECDDNGIYTFLDNPEDPLSFAVWTPGYERMLVRPQDRERWRVDDNSYTLALRKEAIFEGVLLRNGECSPGTKLTLLWMGYGRSEEIVSYNQRYEEVVTGTKGEFHWESLSPGEYSVTVWKSEHGKSVVEWGKVIELKAGEVCWDNLGEELGNNTITGKVTEHGDKPTATMTLSLKAPRKSFLRFETTVNGLGDFCFDSVVPDGEYMLEAFKRIGNEYQQVAKKSLVVTGDLNLQWEVAPGNLSLEVNFPGGVNHGGWNLDDVEVNLRSIYTKQSSFTIETQWMKVLDGTAVIKESLDPGRYQVCVKRPAYDGYQKLFLPTVYSITPEQADEVLDTINFPDLLPMKMKVKSDLAQDFTPPSVDIMIKSVKPEFLSTGYLSALPVDGSFHEQRLLPAGDYRIMFYSQGLSVTPSHYEVHLERGHVPEVVFTIQNDQ